MSVQSDSSIFLVPISEKIVARLISLRAANDEPIEDVVARLAGIDERAPSMSRPECGPQDQPIQYSHNGHGYVAEVLGERVEASSLGSLFAGVVDLISQLDPAVIERLSSMRARTRRYVSKTKSEIHPGRPDLKTIRTRSGWWVSGNVGLDDARRALNALCVAGSLEFGVDVRFVSIINRVPRAPR